MNFCTLFDSNYLDRALLTYESLAGVCDEALLYVIAFDKKCSQVLTDLALPRMIVISYDEFEDDTLIKARSNRSPREFFWTCSGYGIRYIMRRFGLDVCTYIDSDLYFYCSPAPAVTRFVESGSDAAIISHRYSKNPENLYNEKVFGKYCVEFNTFRNTANGMAILDWWIDRCIECCTETAQNGLFGDQKYLDDLTKLFKGVYVYEDFGLGVAPWNVNDYIKRSDMIMNRHTKETGRMVFYHFHLLDVFEDGGSNIRVFIRPGKHDRVLVESIYKPYISALIVKRRLLADRYGLYGEDDTEKNVKIHEGELKKFLTCEPNLWFLARKIIRYALHKNKDYLKV